MIKGSLHIDLDITYVYVCIPQVIWVYLFIYVYFYCVTASSTFHIIHLPICYLLIYSSTKQIVV